VSYGSDRLFSHQTCDVLFGISGQLLSDVLLIIVSKATNLGHNDRRSSGGRRVADRLSETLN